MPKILVIVSHIVLFSENDNFVMQKTLNFFSKKVIAIDFYPMYDENKTKKRMSSTFVNTYSTISLNFFKNKQKKEDTMFAASYPMGKKLKKTKNTYKFVFESNL